MTTRLDIAASVAVLVVAAVCGSGNPRSESPEGVAPGGGCVRAAGVAPEPEETDLQDDVVHHGFLRECMDGRPAILTIDLVQYYEGEQAIREAAKDGETLEPDVDPVMYVRNRNPKLRRLGVKPDARVLMFDCSIPGCVPKHVQLDELPWNELYRFQLQNGLIVYIELPYSP